MSTNELIVTLSVGGANDAADAFAGMGWWLVRRYDSERT